MPEVGHPSLLPSLQVRFLYAARERLTGLPLRHAPSQMVV